MNHFGHVTCKLFDAYGACTHPDRFEMVMKKLLQYGIPTIELRLSDQQLDLVLSKVSDVDVIRAHILAY